jgi:hypothetical protein
MATMVGKILEVEQQEGSDWTDIKTDNPDIPKLRTKMAGKAREAGQLKLSGEVAVIRYTHKPRTDANGRVWDNYYYESAATAPPDAVTNGGGDGITRTAPPPQQRGDGITHSAGGTRSKTDPEDAWRMAKSTGAKLAVDTLPQLDDRTWRSQTDLALAWAVWIYTTAMPQTGQQAVVGQAEPPTQGPGAYGDADFEFGDPGSEAPPRQFGEFPSGY